MSRSKQKSTVRETVYHFLATLFRRFEVSSFEKAYDVIADSVGGADVSLGWRYVTGNSPHGRRGAAESFQGGSQDTRKKERTLLRYELIGRALIVMHLTSFPLTLPLTK